MTVLPGPTTVLSGQGTAWTRSLRLARRRTLPHALVIAGAPGVGKTLAAHLLAKALLCESEAPSDSERSCGSCAACRRFDAGTHPDLFLVAPAADKREIAVEQVRTLQQSLLLVAAGGRARVVILDPADALNESGQNALLKTLEEPLADTFLLLLTSRPEQLLATVRSRAQRLAIVPLGPGELEAALAATPGGNEGAQNSPPDRIAAAARLSQGSLGLARQLLAEGVLELLPLVEQAVGGGAGTTPPELAKALLAGATGRAEIERRARLVLLLLRRTLSGSDGRARLAAGVGGSYAQPPSDRWISRCEALCDAEADLGLQISPELALAVALQKLR